MSKSSGTFLWPQIAALWFFSLFQNGSSSVSISTDWQNDAPHGFSFVYALYCSQ